MRVLFDIVHPAHVHFFKYLHADLVAEGHETLVIAARRTSRSRSSTSTGFRTRPSVDRGEPIAWVRPGN